ncbi:EAL domain-containing protein [Marinobacter qingdaonensis]|uniref:EAL domain-containing protein n=1 Tax=Marinobacter qingdaonensis TaxID=3108486 RepID=A0ABU5NZ14_9GAMM|nr:EAL domain-containing protein [Marinobacter sp. ASW11-75]MEA1080942.1 EAL domain-containing protein [Marinobacter sp. ASW11-75]
MTEPTLRILLIEDDEDDYLITRDILEDAAYVRTELTWEETLAGALSVLETRTFDVVLVDFRIGADSGLDLIQQAQDQKIATPFILLTGQGDNELDARAVSLGAADYLVKGKLDGHTLVRSIRYAIDRSVANERLANSEKHYRILFEHNPAPMCLVAPDSGRLVAMNQSALSLYGVPAQETGSLSLVDLRVGHNYALEAQQSLTLREGRSLEHHRSRTGREMFVEVLSEEIVLGGTQLDLMMITDVTKQVEDTNRLNLLRRCIESSFNGITICDAQEPDLPLVYVNSTFEKMTGYEQSEVIGRNCRFLQGDIDDPSNSGALREIRAALTSQSEASVVIKNLKKDGTPFWNNLYLSPVRDDSNRVTHYIGIQNDISDHKAIENQLAYNASHDVLTNLPNRALLEDRLVQGAQVAVRYGRVLGLLYIGIDGFKLINESLGHRIGDQVLIEVASRLCGQIRERDTVARINGDEFAVLLPDLAHANDVVSVVEEVTRKLSMPYRIIDEIIHLTVSIGIITTDNTVETPQDLIKQANLAMHHAKELGRNNYQWFSTALDTRAHYRIRLRNELQEAIETSQIQVFYQPLIDARTGQTRSIEALVRWEHPTKGIMPPGDFVPLAEETGQIIELGAAVLKQACRDIVALHASGYKECSVSVNVSPTQLRKAGFADTVRDALVQSGLAPENLELEIVESAVLYDADQVISTLNDLKGLGVRIVIDDFGTGFSSLSYLKLFPADKIKIDRSFIKDVIRDRSDAAITQGVISMAHHLRLDVVAEGVETDAHAAFLRRHGCDLLQGFLFSRPMPFTQLKEFMVANQQHLRDTKTPNAEEASGKTLLLLDDESNILRALVRVFRRDGYQILSTTSVQEAFSLLAANEVQVIISDQRMPEMSGTEFFSRVKAIYPNTVRIILSGYTDLKSVTEAINEGSIYKFLTKPWDDKQIREQIGQAFRFHASLHS